MLDIRQDIHIYFENSRISGPTLVYLEAHVTLPVGAQHHRSVRVAHGRGLKHGIRVKC